MLTPVRMKNLQVQVRFISEFLKETLPILQQINREATEHALDALVFKGGHSHINYDRVNEVKTCLKL